MDVKGSKDSYEIYDKKTNIEDQDLGVMFNKQDVIGVFKGRKVTFEGKKVDDSFGAKLKDIIFKIFGIQHSDKEMGILLKNVKNEIKFKPLSSLSDEEKEDLGIDRLSLQQTNIKDVTEAIVATPVRTRMINKFYEHINALRFVELAPEARSKIRTFIEHLDMTPTELETQLQKLGSTVNYALEQKTLDTILMVVDQIDAKEKSNTDLVSSNATETSFGFHYNTDIDGKKTLVIREVNLQFPLK